jgi:NADPH2:quinone reductase
MVIPAFGPLQSFEKRDLPTPKPRAGEILVRVIASGTNPVDAKIRASGYWAKITPPVVLGYDVSGIVDELGPGVTEFAVGDEVFYTPEIFENHYGSYAEFNVVPAAIVARKPRNLSHIEAAAVPLAGGTAWEAVIRRLKLRLWETILIHGGAGGVGSFAVQFAKATGARVIATASTSNQDTLKELGADVCIDYRQTDVTEAVLRETDGKGVDAVFDTVGGTMIAQSLAMVRPFGRLATVLGPQGDLAPLYTRNLTLHGVFLTRERARLEEMTPLLERGLVRPLIDQVLPLEEVAKAHERLDSGHGRGKIVLRVAED